MTPEITCDISETHTAHFKGYTEDLSATNSTHEMQLKI